MTTPQEGAPLPELTAEQIQLCASLRAAALSPAYAMRRAMQVGIAIGRATAASDSASVRRDALEEAMAEVRNLIGRSRERMIEDALAAIDALASQPIDDQQANDAAVATHNPAPPELGRCAITVDRGKYAGYCQRRAIAGSSYCAQHAAMHTERTDR